MVSEILSTLAPEQLTDLVGFVKGVISAIGGLLTIYIAISIWKFILTRKNQKMLLDIQQDIRKIKRKLKIN